MSHLQPPSSYVGSYPVESVASHEKEVFTPVCLRTHWDPTQMIQRILPQQHVALPQDFRPWTRVCKEYVTSAPAEMAPLPPKDMVFPMGGQFYPPGRYSSRIDAESELRTLSYPLDKWCATTQYVPREDSTMYVAGSTVPNRPSLPNAFVSELSMPQALLRADGTTCRSENDSLYFERSGRLFNNPTKQDRYGADKYYASPDRDHEKGYPMPHGGVPMPKPTAQAGRSRWIIPQPGGSVPREQQAQAQQAQAQAQQAQAQRTQRQVPGQRTSVVGVATTGLAAPVW